MNNPQRGQTTSPLDMPKVSQPPVALLWERYSFDPLAGTFHNQRTGKAIQGHASSNGRAWLLNFKWSCQRFQTSYGRAVKAWLAGAWPIQEVDHKDRNPANNRPGNLREVTTRVNAQNRSSFAGAYFCHTRQKWLARARFGGKLTYLGQFDSKEAAQHAYWAALERYA